MSPRLPLVSVIACLSFAACGGGGGGSTPSPQLSPATALAGIAPDAATIQLSWDDPNLFEAGYSIERAGGPFQVIATVGPNITAYTDTGLAPRQPYRYRIRAFGGGGTSSYSNVITVTPPLPPQPTLTTVMPNEAFVGTVVGLRGTGFTNYSPGTNMVLFGGVPSSVVSALSNDSLTAVVPPTAGVVNVDLANANGQATLTSDFTAFAHPPIFPAAHTDIDTGPNAAGAPQLHCEGQNVYAVWAAIPPGLSNDIYFSRSADGGSTWSAPQRLDAKDPPGASGSASPAICSDGDNVFVAWRDLRVGGEARIFMNRSTDGGLTWHGDAEVGSPPPGPREARLPNLACDGDTVYVTYLDTRLGNLNVFVSRSDDAGATWQPDARIDVDNTGQAILNTPRIALSGNRVHVVWTDERGLSPDIYSNRSMNRGATWLPQTVRVDTGAFGDSLAPRIEVAGDRVYVVYQDFRNGNVDIYFNLSTDAGATFAPQDTPLGLGLADASVPRMRSAGQNVYVVWTENGTVQLARSANRGDSFFAASRVDTGVAMADRARLSGDGHQLFVTWILNGNEAWLTSSVNDGATLQAGGEVRISPPASAVNAAALSSAGPRAYLVYKTAADQIHATRNTPQ